MGRIDQVTAKFRVHEDTARTVHENHRTEFRYVIRPRVTGTIEFPSLRITWFDTVGNSYETIFTGKTPLHVLPARIVKTHHAASADFRWTDAPDEADRRLPAALRPDEDGWKRLTWRDERIAPLIAALGPAQFLAVIVFLALLSEGKTFRRRLRCLAAGFTLRRRLRRLDRAKAASPAAAACATWKAVHDFFAARLDIPSGRNTPRELWQAAAARVPRNTDTDVCRNIMQSCYHRCYAPHPLPALLMKNPLQTRSENETLMRELPFLMPWRGSPSRKQVENSVTGPKTMTSTPVFAALAALLILAGLAVMPQSARPCSYEKQVRQHIWEEANALAETASSPAEYEAARQRYRLLEETGAHNAALFYNHGTLCLKNGNASSALALLKRAEKIEGSQRTDLRHNLHMSLRLHAAETSRPALSDRIRAAGFNPVRLSCISRLRLTALLFCAAWIFPSLRRLRRVRKTKIPTNL